MNDQIRLSFPVNPAYVSSARLTASSIANRIRFDIDEIEEIKTAVSEACTYIIKRLTNFEGGNFELCFMPATDEITVEIAAEEKGNIPSADLQIEGDMSLMMIKALVDELSITKPTEKRISITMVKRHKETLFE